MNKSQIIYKARIAGIGWDKIGEVFGVTRQAILQYAVRWGAWNKLENRRLKGIRNLKKSAKKLLTG